MAFVVPETILAANQLVDAFADVDVIVKVVIFDVSVGGVEYVIYAAS